jgi:hypothetical protein
MNITPLYHRIGQGNVAKIIRFEFFGNKKASANKLPIIKNILDFSSVSYYNVYQCQTYLLK